MNLGLEVLQQVGVWGLRSFSSSGVDSALPWGAVGAWTRDLVNVTEFNFWVKNCVQKSCLKGTELLSSFPARRGKSGFRHEQDTAKQSGERLLCRGVLSNPNLAFNVLT